MLVVIVMVAVIATPVTVVIVTATVIVTVTVTHCIHATTTYTISRPLFWVPQCTRGSRGSGGCPRSTDCDPIGDLGHRP